MKKTGCFIVSFFVCLILVSAQNNKSITLEDIWRDYKFSPNQIGGLRSMNNGLYYTVLEPRKEGMCVVKYAYTNRSYEKILVNAVDLKLSNEMISIDDYEFSADETKLLIASDRESIYRHSTKSHYYIYDISTKSLSKLTDNTTKQMYASFSPSANKVAYVLDNNLYYKDLTTNKVTQITSDGEKNKIINGASDWVYEEELVLVKAFKWAPDGNKIAFFRFDETDVKEWLIKRYGALYPEEERFKYPKAGEVNSKVEVYFYDLKMATKVKANIGGEYEYISRINWTNDAKNLAIQTLNRHQNDLNIYLTNSTSGESKILYHEEDERYIDVPTTEFLTSKDQFLITSEKDGFNHFYLYDISGKLINQVTKGQWEVTDYYGIDEKKGMLYYQSSEVSPKEKQVYAIHLNGSSKKQLTQRKGTNNADFSTTFKYFINHHTTANTPHYITLNDNTGKEKMLLGDNADLKNRLTDYTISPKQFFQINVNGNDLNAWKIVPADFDSTKKYPVLMFVYGGPGSNTVKDEWGGPNYFWFQLLANEGYVVISVDNRGTGGRGAAFKKMTYKQLGKYETEDQIAAAKYLATLPYIDGSRIGIFGWSYGGYMSSLCITKGADVFKTAIAVAPVTNWRYYDNIYTERYMQTPQENEAGYDDNSPINHVEKLKGNYLLLHGMADDNVHYQNTVEMTTALIEANKQFTQMAYPNKNHGIYGGNTRLHLYQLMTNFILDNL